MSKDDDPKNPQGKQTNQEEYVIYNSSYGVGYLDKPPNAEAAAVPWSIRLCKGGSGTLATQAMQRQQRFPGHSGYAEAAAVPWSLRLCRGGSGTLVTQAMQRRQLYPGHSGYAAAAVVPWSLRLCGGGSGTLVTQALAGPHFMR